MSGWQWTGIVAVALFYAVGVWVTWRALARAPMEPAGKEGDEPG